ncbi:unnamed protein product [Oikopleura dioica]|uniref:TNFR-Cys domain-containing protein n=1 Tax=Oikopleura dioica TaxID=34765 RepID=E4XPH5_OIKDI|nr:unnamed protein product [Oikopleura dioica]
MLYFSAVFFLQAYAIQQRTDLPCEDQELSDQCSKECRNDYISCFANCESSYCNSECLEVYQDCEASCPCGLSCPGGCANCDHELCQARCHDAHENNDEYRLCFYDALFEHNLCLKECPASAACHELCFDIYSDKMATCPCMETQTTSTSVPTTTEIATTSKTVSTTGSLSTTNTSSPITPSDVFILVIPRYVDKSYLQSGDGSSQVSATINAPENNYAHYAAHALVNGKLYIFGGQYDRTKIARLDDCTLNELTVRLNAERRYGHAALSIENGKNALICFGWSGDIFKTCEIFDGSTTVSTFASDSTHRYGGLGLYKSQPTSVGCNYEQHQKAETLSASGWTALPDHPKRISEHSLVALENQSMLLIGGRDWGNGAYQSGIWQLKYENWNQIGEFLQADYAGSAIYIGRSIYYFGASSKAIQRLDFNETEVLQNVAPIGKQPGNYYLPVLFQTVSNYCL